MAGYFLQGVGGRLTCPHCSGTDCAGASDPDPDKARLICCATGRAVTDKMLRDTNTKVTN